MDRAHLPSRAGHHARWPGPMGRVESVRPGQPAGNEFLGLHFLG